MNTIVPDYPAFVDAARQALMSGHEHVLDSLGWWDLLDAASADMEARAAVYSLFEAEGWECRSSGGLAAIAASPYVGIEGGHGPVRTRSVVDPTGPAARGLVLRGAEGADVMRDVDGAGLAFLGEGDVVWGATAGTRDVGRLVGDGPPTRSIPADGPLCQARMTSVTATRLALAFSLVGLCRSLQSRALTHALEREQFGQPIGRFQAIRHLLATMVVETEAASDVCQLALTRPAESPDAATAARLAKALAGRSATRVAQHALQIFGAAGFTWEHPYTGVQRRVLVLDSLYGSSASLSAAIGSSADRSSLLSFSQQIWRSRTEADDAARAPATLDMVGTSTYHADQSV